MQRSLADLDELPLRVREPLSKGYISEAIFALRGGAFRAAIVSTWIAVIYDIMAKLRELASQQDRAAQKHTESIDRAISSRNRSQLQNIEASLLEVAHKEFEFISSREYEELKRLQEDRHLCAHPAFVAEDQLFSPSPELVRSHIVHAVASLLSQAPLQGKSALRRIISDIRSESFPSHEDDVDKFLNEKYLRRSKESLIRNLIIVLMKELFNDQPTEPDPSKIILCLKSVSRRSAAIFDQVAPRTIAQLAHDVQLEDLGPLCMLIGADQRAWSWLPDPIKLSIKELLERGAMDVRLVRKALPAVAAAGSIDDLRDPVVTIYGLSPVELRKPMIDLASDKSIFVGPTVQLFSEAASFRSAETLGMVVLSLAEVLTEEDIATVLNAVMENNQICAAHGIPSILENLFEETSQRLPSCKRLWSKMLKRLSSDGHEWTEEMYGSLRRRVRG
jgi:hypothetical protein